MLSDLRWRPASCRAGRLSLNALSSIVCFLTRRVMPGPTLPRSSSQCPLEHCMLSDCRIQYGGHGGLISLNALSSIVCFLTQCFYHFLLIGIKGSQCPLEHCMLSDLSVDGLQRRQPVRLNALSSIVCFLTRLGLVCLSRVYQSVSMPSRALYAF